MVKKYLNRTEKEAVTIIYAFTTYLDALSQTLRSKVALKWCRCAKSFTLKLLDQYIIGIDVEQVKQVQRVMEKMRVHVKYPDQCKGTREDVVLLEDDFSKLCELVADVHCRGCKGSGVSCSTRDLFLRCGLDVVSEDGCPYRC